MYREFTCLRRRIRSMTRTDARERIMQMLFQMEIQNDYSDSAREQYMTEHFPGESQKDYAGQLALAVTEHLEEIDGRLNKTSKKWNTRRMAKVDLAIARIAVCEIFYMEGIPEAVAINEAVDMAKKYSTEDSRRFINGLLGQIVKQKDE